MFCDLALLTSLPAPLRASANWDSPFLFVSKTADAPTLPIPTPVNGEPRSLPNTMKPHIPPSAIRYREISTNLVRKQTKFLLHTEED